MGLVIHNLLGISRTGVPKSDDVQPAERPAGWERAIAAPVLKEVEVSRTFLSDDAHTIGLPPRVTQPSVGRYVREVKHYRDASAGTHYGLYSGVNLLPVFGERMKNVPTVPRTHHHFGTGVNTGFLATKLHPSVVSIKLLANRAQWVPGPSEAALTISQLPHRPRRKHPPEHEAVFPFPKNFAPTKASQAKKMCDSDVQPSDPNEESEQTVVLPMSSLLWGTPFWYDGSLRRPKGPLGDLDDYGFSKLLKDEERSTITCDLQVNDPGFYVPGQITIGTDVVTKDPTKDTTEKKETVPHQVRSDERKPLYKRRVIPYRPPYEHYQLDPWIGQDKKNLAKVGTAFKSEECRKHYLEWPPGEQPFVVLRRCDYPDIKLSVL